MTNQQGAPEALTDPSPDQLRAIARTARNSSGSASDDCGPLAYVLHGWRAAAIAFRAQQAALVDAQQPAPSAAAAGQRRSDLVPGVMHCAKCKFQLNRITLCVSDGNAYAGNNKTEPCPNGCGPLWPVTWEQEARNCWKALEEMHERLHPAPTPQADSSQDEPLQAFDSPRAKALMRAWEEGWAACRDAEYVGEEAQNDAFNSSHTLTLCIAEDQQLPAPQADSQPAHQWDTGYPPLPRPDLYDSAAGTVGWSESALQGFVDADRAARAPADSVTAPAAYSGNLEQELAMLIRRIVSSARRNCEDGSNVLKLANEAWAYLVRKGLNGSPLRDAGIETAPTPPAQAADSVLEDAARLERERICAAIKAEDDYCIDQGDYMLDSDDCIKIVRGEWVRPDFAVDAARKKGANHDHT